MKTIFRFFGSTALLTGLVAAGSLGVFAQDTPAPNPCDNIDGANGLYKKVTDNYGTQTIPAQKAAIEAGEEYVKVYGACEQYKAQVTFVKDYLPGAKTWVTKAGEAEEMNKLFGAFDTSVKAGKFDESFTIGKSITAKQPDNLNIPIILGSIGLAETGKTPRVTKYNADSISFAKTAIQKLNEGKTSPKFGALMYEYNSKDNALGWLNYSIGYQMYYGQSNKKEALGYLYKATQSGTTKDLAQVYGIIGDYYYDEVKRLGEDYAVKTKAANNQDTDETKAIVAQLKAYAERATDVYGRAAKLAKDAKYKDGLNKSMSDMYRMRFQKTEGAAEFVASQNAKPMPDPTTVPTPIVEADPADAAKPSTQGATTPAGATATPTAGTKPANTTPTSGTKPATTPATNGTKPAATPATKKPVSVNGTTSSNTTAKKPVVKKKGTR